MQAATKTHAMSHNSPDLWLPVQPLTNMTPIPFIPHLIGRDAFLRPLQQPLLRQELTMGLEHRLHLWPRNKVSRIDVCRGEGGEEQSFPLVIFMKIRGWMRLPGVPGVPSPPATPTTPAWWTSAQQKRWGCVRLSRQLRFESRTGYDRTSPCHLAPPPLTPPTHTHTYLELETAIPITYIDDH